MQEHKREGNTHHARIQVGLLWLRHASSRPRLHSPRVRLHVQRLAHHNVPGITGLIPLVLSEALIEDINTDKCVALKSLSREAYMKFGVDPNSANGAFGREEKSSLSS